jgi:hypothetical protein
MICRSVRNPIRFQRMRHAADVTRRSLSGLKVAVCALGVASFGCVERKLTVTSEPEGSLAYLNNQEIGRTTVTRRFTWYGNYDVELRQDGHTTLKTNAWVPAPWWQWPPFDLVAEVLPFWFVDQQKIALAMKPTDPAASQPADMLTRASDLRSRLESSASTRQPTTQPSSLP